MSMRRLISLQGHIKTTLYYICCNENVHRCRSEYDDELCVGPTREDAWETKLLKGYVFKLVS